VSLWGDPDPTGVNPLLDFNSTIELYRELLGAMYRNLAGAPNVQIGEFVWDQPSNENRLGRLLKGHVAFAVDITDEPYTIVPFANPGVPGTSVEAVVTVAAVFPDGSSTVTGSIVLP
jgi:hypothetical protein